MGGFAAGFVGSGGDLEAGLIGAVAAAASFGVGQLAGQVSQYSTVAGNSVKVVGHGLVGGAQAAASGGKFGAGILSAIVPAGAAAAGVPQNALTSAILGGTASRLGGGKFANGAVTGAFAYSFSQGMQNATQGGGFSLSGLARGALDAVGKIWALPNTLIGLAYGGLGYAAGWAGYAMGLQALPPDVIAGNNSLQFIRNPFASLGAITFGNVTVFGGDLTDLGADGNQMWVHEMQHTYQAQILGPLYLPSNIVGIAAGVVTGGGAHGAWNWNEIGPQQHPPQPWP